MKTNFPEEYTRWWVEFYYQKFQINEQVLIPRLETESLVREAIKFCRLHTPDILIDIGTGSGIIPLSILSAMDISQVFALDISIEALKVARDNSVMQWKFITFFESDLLNVFLKEDLLVKWADTLIVTNLPYIKQDDWEHMSNDTIHEPKLALFGWQYSGFELYEKLFVQVEQFVQKYEPKNLTLLAEMGDDQTDIAREILSKYGWEFSFFRDLRSIERFIKIKVR